MSQNFTDRIKRLRKRLCLTQNRFARRVGISQGYLSMIEANKAEPTDELRVRVRVLELNPKIRFVNGNAGKSSEAVS